MRLWNLRIDFRIGNSCRIIYAEPTSTINRQFSNYEYKEKTNKTKEDRKNLMRTVNRIRIKKTDSREDPKDFRKTKSAGKSSDIFDPEPVP